MRNRILTLSRIETARNDISLLDSPRGRFLRRVEALVVHPVRHGDGLSLAR